MSARLVVAIVVTAGALAWLGAALQRAPQLPETPDVAAPPESIPIEPARPVAADEAKADADPAPQRDPTEARELEPAPQAGAFAWHADAPEAGWLERWRVALGGSREKCVKILGAKDESCRMAFESRDPNWAAEAELRIREIVAEKEFLRPTGEDWRHGPVECFTTICRVVLDVDRQGLVDHLRSIGRYSGDPPDRESTEVSRWVFDRLEEIHLALVVDGIIEEGAEATPRAFAPVPHDTRISLAEIVVYRCPSRLDVCAGPSR